MEPTDTWNLWISWILPFSSGNEELWLPRDIWEIKLFTLEFTSTYYKGIVDTDTSYGVYHNWNLFNQVGVIKSQTCILQSSETALRTRLKSRGELANLLGMSEFSPKIAAERAFYEDSSPVRRKKRKSPNL
ncbi:unnamed protein product [Blepharisma stoltei]|uniref:Uncharacterized protein n=1 Tax=Blepharisma stoltei TaxID=1481888 RepID=A0AAU9K8M5_9CILI|nr:unnamed protein product [Blepharisma stoltei]